MQIIFRTDSNNTIGTGHLMRCLSLAKELENKTNISFILSHESSNAESLIKAKLNSCNVFVLPKSKYQYKHEQIFNFEQANEDAHSTRNINQIGKTDWLIIDHYGIDEKWEIQFKDIIKRIMVIDDLANRKHHADILLDQNPYLNANKRYDNLVDNDCLHLIGPSYALLRDEFRITPKCMIKDNVENILISFGGVDFNNTTTNVLNALKDEKYRDININVVMGNSCKHKEDVKKLCSDRLNFIYHEQISYMAKLMSDVDLFIGAGGSTSLERMAMGLPSIVFSIANNQTKICEDLASQNLVKYAGLAENFDINEFENLLDLSIKDFSWRKFVNSESVKLVDGRGVKKLSSIILSAGINFRKVTINDSKKIFDWRNDEINRRFSNNPDKFSFSSHHQWLISFLNSDNDLLIAKSEEYEVGVVRFDYKDNIAFISIYLVPTWHGLGYGRAILFSAISWLNNHKNGINRIEAEVLNSNKASLKIFFDTGFEILESCDDKKLLVKEI